MPIMACDAHPEVPERRACTQCKKRWCNACVRAVGNAGHEICPTCGHLVEAASASTSTEEGIVEAIKRVGTLEGVTTNLAFALCYQAAVVSPLFSGFYFAALVGYYFTIIHHVGEGGDGLPGPSDAVDDWVETLGILAKGLGCALVGVAPLVVFLVMFGEAPPLGMALILVALGQLYMPAILLALVFTNDLYVLVWPFAWARVIARAPRPYAMFALMWLATVLVALLLFAVLWGLFANVPFGRFLMALGWNAFWFAQASFVGIYLRTHRAAYGW